MGNPLKLKSIAVLFNPLKLLSKRGRDGKLLKDYISRQLWDKICCFVKKGGEVTYRNKKGESLLHVVLRDPSVPVDVVRVLIHPDLINSFCAQGFTPLHVAATTHNTLHVIHGVALL